MRRARRAVLLPFLIGALALVGERAEAAGICLEHLLERFPLPVALPLGCELVDCCPGCPADAPLDLRVRLRGEGVAEATLRLRGPGAGKEGVRTLRVGETRLEDVAPARAEDPPPEAALEVRLEPDAPKRWREAAKGAPPGAALARGSLAVEQLLEGVVVNERRLEWAIFSCDDDAGPCDRIVQPVNRGSDASVLLLDARREAGAEGCSDDEVERSVQSEALENVLEPDGCRSELGVFSEGDAAFFREELEDWSDACGDEVEAKLEPPVSAPMNVWLGVSPLGPAFGWGELDPKDVVDQDVETALAIYDGNKTGISFEPKVVKVEGEDWEKVYEVLEETPLLELFLEAVVEEDPYYPACALPQRLEEIGFYVPGELNVYYLPIPFTGLICEDDRNAIFMGMAKKPTTLAHELGHALSLLGGGAGHTNGIAGFDETNVMWVKEPTPRDHFSLGQAFRQNLATSSILHQNGLRGPPKRSCPPDEESPACPRLGLDWIRP